MENFIPQIALKEVMDRNNAYDIGMRMPNKIKKTRKLSEIVQNISKKDFPSVISHMVDFCVGFGIGPDINDPFMIDSVNTPFEAEFLDALIRLNGLKSFIKQYNDGIILITGNAYQKMTTLYKQRVRFGMEPHEDFELLMNISYHPSAVENVDEKDRVFTLVTDAMKLVNTFQNQWYDNLSEEVTRKYQYPRIEWIVDLMHYYRLASGLDFALVINRITHGTNILACIFLELGERLVYQMLQSGTIKVHNEVKDIVDNLLDTLNDCNWDINAFPFDIHY